MAGGALPGFRDFYPDEFAHRAHIMRAWREVARRYAFVEYDGPPLEPLDLYTRKSGDEIVAQLYEFKDKGDRHVALRPEMTPTFARMVAARANGLRKPVKWFSIPQLFRYERQQKGRLKEHFQLNVDIVGEASEVADAELLAVAIDIMRELGLTSSDVRARVSDRRLLLAMLDAIGVGESAHATVFSVLDKKGREQQDSASNRLTEAGLDAIQVGAVFGWIYSPTTVTSLRSEFGHTPVVLDLLNRFAAYEAHLAGLGVGDWVELDLSIVRGLAYYTGIVFELFDAKGELRAICGGGRYDRLLHDLGGTDLPALGFGMGDVVLGELLKDRGLMTAATPETPDLYVIGGPGSPAGGTAGGLQLVAALRRAGFTVDHGLSEKKYASPPRGQFEAGQKAGALAAIYFDGAGTVTAKSLTGKFAGAAEHTCPSEHLLAGDDETVRQLRMYLDELRRRSGMSDSA